MCPFTGVAVFAVFAVSGLETTGRRAIRGVRGSRDGGVTLERVIVDLGGAGDAEGEEAEEAAEEAVGEAVGEAAAARLRAIEGLFGRGTVGGIGQQH